MINQHYYVLEYCSTLNRTIQQLDQVEGCIHFQVSVQSDRVTVFVAWQCSTPKTQVIPIFGGREQINKIVIK